MQLSIFYLYLVVQKKFGNPKEVTSSTAVFTRSRLRLWTFTPTDPKQKFFFRPEILWSHLSDI